METEWAEQERRLLYSCYRVASEALVIPKDREAAQLPGQEMVEINQLGVARSRSMQTFWR